MGKLKLWTLQEDNILTQVSRSTNSKKWKKASEELKRHGYDRTDIQCRERYVNHLDPTVNKESWTEEELQILYSKYSEYGNKWFLIQKHLPGRTQTKIKNYFYGNIRYLLKIILKVVFSKSRTGFVNDIKTDTLLDMYEGKGEYSGETVIQKSIKTLKYKVNRHNCQKLMENNLQAFTYFGKKYLMAKQCKQKPQIKMEEEGDSELQEQKQQNVSAERSLKCPKVEVVSMLEGEVCPRDSQLAYLQKMANLHYTKFLQFQQIINGVQLDIK